MKKSNILSTAGKGDAPRNIFSKQFRDEHDRIFGVKKPKFCPHGVPIGGDCVECLRALPIEFLAGSGINRITKILPKKKS